MTLVDPRYSAQINSFLEPRHHYVVVAGRRLSRRLKTPRAHSGQLKIMILSGQDHIGSTAVPGLDAKPIIDILVVLDDTHDINSFDRTMEDAGYRVRGECLDAPIPGTPGRFYFTKETNGVRSHHVHVCAKGHREIFDKLAFRDYLRAHSSKAAAYGELKRRIAAQYLFDNIGYMHAKNGFVKTTLLEARSWCEQSGKEKPTDVRA